MPGMGLLSRWRSQGQGHPDASGELLPLGKRVTRDVTDELIANAPGVVSHILRGCLTANRTERSSARDIHVLAVAAFAQVLIDVS